MILNIKQYIQLVILAIMSSLLFSYSFTYIHNSFYSLLGPQTYTFMGPFFGVAFAIYILLNHSQVKKINLSLFAFGSVISFIFAIPISYFVSSLIFIFLLYINFNVDVFGFFFMGQHSFGIIENFAGGMTLFIIIILLARGFITKIKILKPIMFIILATLILSSVAVQIHILQDGYFFEMPLGFVGYYIIDIAIMIVLGLLVTKSFSQTATLSSSNPS